MLACEVELKCENKRLKKLKAESEIGGETPKNRMMNDGSPQLEDAKVNGEGQKSPALMVD